MRKWALPPEGAHEHPAAAARLFARASLVGPEDLDSDADGVRDVLPWGSLISNGPDRGRDPMTVSTAGGPGEERTLGQLVASALGRTLLSTILRTEIAPRQGRG